VKLALTKGNPGETYCFGGNSERNNLDVVNSICAAMDELKPLPSGSYRSRIEFVADRAGHDFRYAIDDSKAAKELGFTRKYKNFEQGLAETIKWYLANDSWLQTINTRADSPTSNRKKA
jgi:dTDP-glucose 4,6-dehydratase